MAQWEPDILSIAVTGLLFARCVKYFYEFSSSLATSVEILDSLFRRPKALERALTLLTPHSAYLALYGISLALFP
jgi:hypothetical protein